MKKIVRLTESDVRRIVRKVITEDEDMQPDYIKVYHMYKDGEVSKKDFYSYMGILEKHERQGLIDYIESQKRSEQMELNKSTYDKAADAATEKGFSKLGNKFREHGKKFGLNQDEMKINLKLNLFTGFDEQDDDSHVDSEFIIKDVEKEDGSENTYNFKLQSIKSGRDLNLVGNKIGNRMNFLLKGEFQALPLTRRDAKLILKLLSNKGVDVSDVDIRSINYNDSDFR